LFSAFNPDGAEDRYQRRTKELEQPKHHTVEIFDRQYVAIPLAPTRTPTRISPRFGVKINESLQVLARCGKASLLEAARATHLSPDRLLPKVRLPSMVYVGSFFKPWA
jgi:hypothetical protein